MSAGTGVSHSEYNPSDSEPLEFLQIWIQPDVKGLKPQYQQKRFENRTGLQLIASADARDDSLLLHQDASLYQLRLEPSDKASHQLDHERSLYIHVVSGALEVNGETIGEGDGARVTDVGSADFEGLETTEALVFDLP